MDTVKNAEPKTIIIMIVIKIPMDHFNTGHLLEPVFRASQKRAISTGKTKNSVHPTQARRMQSPVRPVH
jgi:hypothetical protein